MAGRIVYGQKDLEKALCEGLSTITLCAGIYDIPLAPGVMFDRLGPVRASVRCTRREAEDAEMLFWDIYPEYRSEYALDYKAPIRTVAVSSGSGSYYTGSGSAGAGLGLGAGSGGSFSSYGTFNIPSSMFGSFGGVQAFIFGYGIDLI